MDNCPQDWSRCPICSTAKIEVRHCRILKRGDMCPTRKLLFMGGSVFKRSTWFRRLKCWYDNWQCGTHGV